jgi:glyoxylase-like metal-dependent hydrolase (beta-lactamase superfamily II)
VPTLIRLALLIVALAVSPPAAAQSERPQPGDGYFQIPRRVGPGVWVLMEPSFQIQPIGNVTVIEQSDGLVLVDAGGSPGSGRRIVAMVRALSCKPVKAVIITHWHGDHPQGLSEILKAWPNAHTIATSATKAHLSDPATMNTPTAPDPAANAAFQKQVQGFVSYTQTMAGRATDAREKTGWQAAERLFRQYAEDMDGAVTLPVAEGFESRLVINDSRAPVEAHFLGRANTDGDAVVWLPRQRILVTGDTVVAPFPFGFGSYPADWLGVLAKLSAYDFRVLVPGHGAPQRDRRYLDRVRAALDDVRTQVRALADAGLTLQETTQRFNAEPQLADFAGDDPWLRRWVRDYWLTPIIASAYKEAKGQPIVQSLRGE